VLQECGRLRKVLESRLFRTVRFLPESRVPTWVSDTLDHRSKNSADVYTLVNRIRSWRLVFSVFCFEPREVTKYVTSHPKTLYGYAKTPRAIC
jgi:hypothetical protein